MDVKSQLKNAQFEHVLEATKGDPLAARFVYATDSGNTYIGNGAVWVRLNESGLADLRISDLEDGIFQTINGDTWILADGRDVTGSDYHALTGKAFVPDYRGMFLRGKNNGREFDDNIGNPDGDLALGAYQGDGVIQHDHGKGLSITTASNGYYTESNSGPVFGYGSTNPYGGNETRPRNMTVNYFIKINK